MKTEYYEGDFSTAQKVVMAVVAMIFIILFVTTIKEVMLPWIAEKIKELIIDNLLSITRLPR